MNRREFLGWVGVGGIASYLPVSLAACSRQTANSGTSTRTDGFESVGTVAELDQKGQILNKQFSGGQVLVVRDPADANIITAVNPTCTHAGCTVNWDKNQNAFVCPCHGSQFSFDGKVIQAPAEKPLTSYEAKLEGDTILVKSS